MRIKILTAALLAAFGLAGVTTAQADFISVRLQQSTVNGGAITTVASGSNSATFKGGYGSFSANIVSGAGSTTTVFPDLVFSNALNTSTSTPGTLTVWITGQGLTQPTGTHTLLSTFTANRVPAEWTVTEKAFYDASNGLFTGTLLGSMTFNGPITPSPDTTIGGLSSNIVDFTTPFSITHEYIITATGAGTTNNTIDTFVAVPEPGTLGIFGLGLLALGLTLRYKRSKG